MAKKPATKTVTAAELARRRLMPPKSGAKVRMYRTGHGDCFLLAFAGETETKPVYVLIDCGYKPGSNAPKFINTSTADITANIREATGGQIDVAVITHEHQDHVNGITEENFEGISIGEAWFAWTEDPKDDLANSLRAKFRDQLLGLFSARNRLATAGDQEQATRIDEFLAFELGGEDEAFNAAEAENLLRAAGDDPAKSKNKQSMKRIKDRAKNGVRYLRPHEAILGLPGARDLRIFVLGPPRDAELLETLDPQGAEEFPGHAFAMSSAGSYLAAAAEGAMQDGQALRPFAGRYCVPWQEAPGHSEFGDFFTRHYGLGDLPPGDDPGLQLTSLPPEAAQAGEVSDDAPWRRIDREWLYSAEQLALNMNDETNNASLVFAFELGKGGKVLLFAADAQRGNWLSWARKDWQDGGETVTAKDLLARTVLYKVGHHGSHNATLNGKPEDDYPNLGWMATGAHAREFTAMITAVRAWAQQDHIQWDHPLKAIKDALERKASGRVFQTDTDLEKMRMADGGSTADWELFLSRTHGDRLYFDYEIPA